MTLQQPKPILCHKCGSEIVFSKDQVAPSGRKIPLDPYFNNDRHDIHCMYANQGDRALETDELLQAFLSLVPNTKKQKVRILFAVGKARI